MANEAAAASFSDLFDTPFFLGTTTSSIDVPGRLPLAIGGRPYLMDTNQLEWRGLPVVRTQADPSKEPGGPTLSPEGLWPRDISEWQLGAGQEWLDREDSERSRFRISKGCEPWVRGKLTLLPDTTLRRASVDVNVRGIRVGTYSYVADGQAVLRSTDMSTFTDIDIDNGETLRTVEAITSDGFNVFAAYGAGGIHRTDRAVITSVHYNDLLATLVSYVKGRLMAAKDNAIYNIIASGAAPAAHFTHLNTDFRWVGFAEGKKKIFAAGFSGDKSMIYAIGLQSGATALDTPIVAGELPDGEIVRSLKGYLGFLLIGTDKGVRFATVDGDDVVPGDIIETNGPVYDFEPQDRFVWFTWKNYDGTSTGLGRLDLRNFTAFNTPAFATDLMAAEQGDVLSVWTTPANTRAFSIAGEGFFEQSGNKVASGEIRSGKLRFGVTEPKVFKYLDLTHEVVPEGATFARSVDIDGVLTDESTEMDSGTKQAYDVRSVVGNTAEIIVTLNRANDTTKGPILVSERLRALPIPSRGERRVLPILLHETIDLIYQKTVLAQEVLDEYRALKVLEKDGRPIIIQIGTESFEAFIDDVRMGPQLKLTEDGSWVEGTCFVIIRKFEE